MTKPANQRAEIRKRELSRRTEGRDLYSNANGEPEFRRSVTAFLDILGTKAALTTMTNADLLEQIRLLDRLNPGLHDSAWEGEWQRMLTFSDSIALAVPLRQNSHGLELGSALDSISAYQFELACAGRFLRGGITIGDAYADYENITGPALVEAADLEANVAVMPRVLLSEAGLRLAIMEGLSGYGDRAFTSEWNSALMIDADGRAFVNYLTTAIDAESNDVALAVDLLEDHKKAVTDALVKHSKPPRVREKYVWVAHYHNTFCAMHRPGEGLEIADPHLSPLEEEYPRPFRLVFTRHSKLAAKSAPAKPLRLRSKQSR
ncbi:hypothetical protein [Prescottella equi]|uniref:hypothetical protein n=1 Tax=Rhodococcus hoagii TaxID=43767 RepID=UPI001EEAAA27|nr:hypothetical protein [Prescottella equi]